jgi:hypothetical protein
VGGRRQRRWCDGRLSHGFPRVTRRWRRRCGRCRPACVRRK